MASQTVENYLKCIYALQRSSEEGVSTNAIADRLETQASSVTDMLKKLKSRKLVDYKKYKGAALTAEGRAIAIDIVRRHRLWETFLVEKLDYKWDEVHDIAEELEHIGPKDFISRLDAFLGYPEYDPHGDPIPDADGVVHDHRDSVAVSTLDSGVQGVVVGVRDSSADFLQYLDSVKLSLGAELVVRDRFAFDQSLQLEVNGEPRQISQLVARNLLVVTKEKTS